jgi:hypothetical protein
LLPELQRLLVTAATVIDRHTNADRRCHACGRAEHTVPLGHRRHLQASLAAAISGTMPR